MAKFKVNDIVRIADINDIAYKNHHFYLILEVNEERGYKIKSLQTLRELYLDEVYSQRISENFDSLYRLVTAQELVLYGKEK